MAQKKTESSEQAYLGLLDNLERRNKDIQKITARVIDFYYDYMCDKAFYHNLIAHYADEPYHYTNSTLNLIKRAEHILKVLSCAIENYEPFELDDVSRE